MFLPTATFQLRDQLVELVGSVSQRLGLILNRTGGLPDAERARINRMAAEIASLQSSILEALNSSAFTAPRALRELYDLELQALQSIEQIERYLPLAVTQSRYSAQPVYAPPPQPAWTDYSSAAHMFRDARAYIDVEAVPVAPQQQYDGNTAIVPSPLTPSEQQLPPQQHYAYGEALRSAVSGLNGYPPQNQHAPEFFGHDHYEQQAWPSHVPVARALVPVNARPQPPAVITNVADTNDDDELERQPLLDRLRSGFSHAGDLRISGRALAIGISILACLYFGSGFFMGSREPIPQAAPAKADAQSQLRVADDRLEPAPKSTAAKMPLNGSRKGPLYVPVIATVSTRDEIEQKLADISRVYPHALTSPDQATIEPIMGSDGRQWYRAFLLPGRPRLETQKFCQGLREAGHIQCWAKRLSGS